VKHPIPESWQLREIYLALKKRDSEKTARLLEITSTTSLTRSRISFYKTGQDE